MAAAPAYPDDPVDAIMAVMERAFDPEFGEAWNRRQVSDALLLGTCNYVLIGSDGRIGPDLEGAAAGFYLARRVLDEEELLLFAVDPAMRGRGLGNALLRHFVASAEERGAARVFLEMRRGNPAEHLYTRHGFRSVGLRPAYYRGRGGARLDAVSFERSFA